MDARNKFQTLIQVRTCSAVQSHGQIENCYENRRTLGRYAFIFPSFLFRKRLLPGLLRGTLGCKVTIGVVVVRLRRCSGFATNFGANLT